MILDAQSVFQGTAGTPQDLGSASTGTTISGSVIDIGALVNDLASRVGGNLGETDLTLHVYVDSEAFTSGGSATVQVALYTHSTTTVTSGTQLALSTAHAVATLVDGFKMWQIKLPVADYNRYVGLGYIVGVAALTAGKVRAFLTVAEDYTPIAQK